MTMAVRLVVDTHKAKMLLREVAEDLSLVAELADRTGVTVRYRLPDIGYSYQADADGSSLTITANLTVQWEGWRPRLTPWAVTVPCKAAFHAGPGQTVVIGGGEGG